MKSLVKALIDALVKIKCMCKIKCCCESECSQGTNGEGYLDECSSSRAVSSSKPLNI